MKNTEMRVELISSLQHKQTRRNFTEPNLEREERGDEKQQKRGQQCLCVQKEVQDGWVTGLSLWMSQLIPATNSWGERQSWKSAAIHKTNPPKNREDRIKNKSVDEKGDVANAVFERPEQQRLNLQQLCVQGWVLNKLNILSAQRSKINDAASTSIS